MTGIRNAIMLLARCACFFILTLNVTLHVCAAPANAAPRDATTRDAMRLLEKSRLATGGAAWDRIQNMHVIVMPNAPTSFDSAEEWVDLSGEQLRQSLDGADGLRFGANRDNSWTKRYDVTTVGAPDAATISNTYNEAFGFRFKRHHLASVAIIRHVRENKRRYAVVRLVPDGGTALDYWIDDATALIGKVQLHDDEGKPTALSEYDDYRRVGGVLLPFHQIIRETSSTHVDDDLNIATIIVNAPLDDAIFTLPPKDKVRGFLPGQAAVQIPFELYHNQIFIGVSLNGYGPFRFVLDTGCNNTISLETMRAAHLREGDAIDQYGFGDAVTHAHLTHVHETQLGMLTLPEQTFTATPIPKDAEFDGIIGYEWLQRLPIKIDYLNHVLTLYNPDGFTYEGIAKAVPLNFRESPQYQGKMYYPAPRIEAAIDGMVGMFDVDTGDFESVMVSSHFAYRHTLLRKYPVTGVSSSRDVNGEVINRLLIRSTAFQIGDNYAAGTQIEISPLQKTGLFADETLDGNIGDDVLRGFDVTLDYRNHAMYLEPNNGLPVQDYHGALGEFTAP